MKFSTGLRVSLCLSGALSTVTAQIPVPDENGRNGPGLQKRAAGPNILFVMSDDQDLHMNSMNAMPNVQKLLAEQGTTYNKHYCTNALCCPSRVSLLTGKAVHNTNVTSVVAPYGGYQKFVNTGLNNDYLPIWLEKAGVNAYYVGKLMNEHGVDNYNKPFPKGWKNSNFLLQPGTYDYVNTTWSYDQKKPQNFPGQNAINLITNNSLEMLDEAVNDGKPFFLAVAPAIPHVGIHATGGTYVPVPVNKWKNAFTDATIPPAKNFNPKDPSGGAWVKTLPQLTQDEIDKHNEFYRARLRVVAGIDDMIGEFVAALEKKGILDNTYIVYTTDNGYHIGQHRLGAGKKCGYEEDINIPMVIRGPNVPMNKATDIVTTHTDLAATFMSMLKLKEQPGMDGKAMPLTQKALDDNKNGPSEHVNVEMWSSGTYNENPLIKAAATVYEEDDEEDVKVQAAIPGIGKNTYKSLRLIGSGYNLYYSVWCTNEHELYNMVDDPYQMNNLLADFKAGTDMSQIKGTMMGHPLSKLVPRIDALQLVLKSCKGASCRDPWKTLHPQGNVKSLSDAMNPEFDTFYQSQPKVGFTGCKPGYLIELEGPQNAKPYST